MYARSIHRNRVYLFSQALVASELEHARYPTDALIGRVKSCRGPCSIRGRPTFRWGRRFGRSFTKPRFGGVFLRSASIR